MDGRRWGTGRTLGLLLVLAGLIWIGQGLGIITYARSFMVGDPTWVLIGAAFVAAGAILASGWRPRRS
jgi:hypothetical protein